MSPPSPGGDRAGDRVNRQRPMSNRSHARHGASMEPPERRARRAVGCGVPRCAGTAALSPAHATLVLGAASILLVGRPLSNKPVKLRETCSCRVPSCASKLSGPEEQGFAARPTPQPRRTEARVAGPIRDAVPGGCRPGGCALAPRGCPTVGCVWASVGHPAGGTSRRPLRWGSRLTWRRGRHLSTAQRQTSVSANERRDVRLPTAWA